MIRKSVKLAILITSIVSILTMTAIGSFLVWVLVAPRSLNFVTPYIEKGLDSFSHEFSVKIESSFVEWDRKQHAFTVHAKNVDILNQNTETIATLPEISFGFSMLRLLTGNLFSSDMTIMEPKIHINTAEKTLSVSREGDESLQTFALNSIYGALSSSSIFKLHSIRTENAQIFVNNGTSEMLWKIDDGYAKLETKKKITQIKSEFKVDFGTDASAFSINIAGAKDNQLDATITFSNLPSHVISDLLPNYEINKKLDMVFSGETNLMIANDGKISQAQFNLSQATGHLDMPDFFKDKVEIKNLSLNATLYNRDTLAITGLTLNLHGPIVKVAGVIHNNKQWPEFLPSIDMHASIDNMEADDIATYWPYKLGNTAWQWVTTNITEGVVKHAEGRFKFSGDDIANIITRENSGIPNDNPPIPDDAINATVYLEKAKVSYLEHFPVVNDVNAAVKFTGHSMDASIESARVLSTSLKNAHVTFDNLWQHPLKIGISGSFSGPAQDAVPFLKASYKEKPENEQMASIYNLTGEATGNIDLAIPFNQPLKYEDIDIKISSNLKNLLLPGLVRGKNVVGSDLEFSLNKSDISVKGDSLINSIPAKIDFHKSFAANVNPQDIDLKLKGTFSPTDIKDLAAIDLPFVTGKIGLDIGIINKNNIATVQGSADVTQSGILISDVGFVKEPGKNGSIAFNLTKNNNETIINDFKAHGDGFDVAGNGKIDSATNSLSELSIANAKFNGNEVSANYKTEKSGASLDIKGKNLDLSRAKFSDWFQPNPAKKSTPLTLNARLDHVTMKNGITINEVSGELTCSEKRCHTGSLYGKLKNDNYVVVSLKNIGDRSSLLIESDNAGDIINAFNISQNITGGHLNIDASLGKRGSVTVANGSVKIYDFTAVKTPLLGKILTLASFRGFEDLLNNQGISFKKFEAPFTISDGVITVKDAKSSGASIGITSAGNINTLKDEVDLRGVIVPAYAVNNIIGKIPFVGKIIIGNDGEGVLATKYSVTGPYDDVKISVNPLSILTPGLLRNLFDVFDNK